MTKPDLHKFSHIAIMQTAFLGDVALTLYLAQAIRNINRTAEITLITTPQAQSIASASLAINTVIVFDKRNRHKGFGGMLELAKTLRDLKVDCIISPHRSLRSSITTFLAKAEFSVGFNTSDFAFLYKKRIPYEFHLHEVHRHLNLLNAFDGFSEAEYHDIEVDISIPRIDKSKVQALLAENKLSKDDKIVILAPTSAWKTKEWGYKKFESLAIKLREASFKPILIGSKEDIEICKEIAKAANVLSLAGRLSILQSIYLISKSKLIITNDSAPTHFAALACTPKIVIFGPTSPIFGFYPRGEKDLIIENTKLKCRPCQIHGGKECPLGTHECMNSISVDNVFTNALSLLK